MHVEPRGNLTVELIRQDRFGPDTPARAHASDHCTDAQSGCRHLAESAPAADAWFCRSDRVELSRQALPSDPWSANVCHGDAVAEPLMQNEVEQKDASEIEPPDERLTPVVGSPALAGLGVALVVPGTLLDVVA